MTTALPNDVHQLEQKLLQQRDPLQRLLLLDQLAAYYSYTDLSRARELLQEQCTLLQHQELPDFQVNYYLHLAIVENQLYNFPAAEVACRRAIEMLEEFGTIKQVAEACIDYVGICINLEDMDTANSYLERAIRVLKNYPDDRLLARATCRRGFIYLHYGAYVESIELLLKANRYLNQLSITLTTKDYYFLTLIHSGLGRIYERNDEHQKSVKAYRKVVKLCERLHMRSRLSWHYLNVGSAYQALDDYTHAEHYFRLAIAAEDDVSKHSRASAYANLGYCALVQEQYQQALDLFDQAEALYHELGRENDVNFSKISGWRGRLYSEIGESERALTELQTALHYAEAANDYKQLAGICTEMASAEAELKHYREAYQYQLISDRYLERYNEQLDKRRRQELEVQYEATQKQQETERLELQASKLQLKALRAQMNPHFLYNALNSIQSFISGNDPSTASRYLAKFAKLMRQSLEYSELEHISLEKEIEFLEDYLFINEKLRFEEQLSYRIEVDDDLEEDIIGVPTMIIQPYVENALEHGLRSRQGGQVVVQFKLYDDDTLLCIVEDNGIGRERAAEMRSQDMRYQNHRSHGTRITEERLQIMHRDRKIGAPVTIEDLRNDNGEAAGTRVLLKIPINELALANSSGIG